MGEWFNFRLITTPSTLIQGRTQDLELGGAPVAYPGFQRGGVLKVRPHTKSGGAVHFRSDIRKVGGGGGGGGAIRFRSDTKSGGGGGASGLIYEKWGGGHSASGPIPLGTQKISTYVLPRYTSHARANEIHAGKG